MQITGLTDGRTANWAPEVEFLSARSPVVKCDDPVLLLNQPIVLYAKHRLSRTQDTNQTALRSAK